MKFSVGDHVENKPAVSRTSLSIPLSSSAKYVALIKTEGREDGAQSAEVVTARISRGTVLVHKMH